MDLQRASVQLKVRTNSDLLRCHRRFIKYSSLCLDSGRSTDWPRDSSESERLSWSRWTSWGRNRPLLTSSWGFFFPSSVGADFDRKFCPCLVFELLISDFFSRNSIRTHFTGEKNLILKFHLHDFKIWLPPLQATRGKYLLNRLLFTFQLFICFLPFLSQPGKWTKIYGMKRTCVFRLAVFQK